ncbi:nucleoside hydrolase [Dyadobacter sp.]|uniref:nucleoside hydrolase n=1 Tax=Dyadobacter sp. TaxID=1914288 RepID=UPI003F730BD7
MEKLPVIIDCDPGLDDALMLMLAFGSDQLDVKAVTVSAGNQTQDKTFTNAIKILSLIGTNAPVFRGAEKPLSCELIISNDMPGEMVFNEPSFPAVTTVPNTIPAAAAMAGILEEATKKVTIVATGPLTNIATFLSNYPNLKVKIERIVLMGGGIFRGNMTPLAEFNMYVDPEAAAIVFRSGVPVTMCGLDVTHKALVFPRDIELFRTFKNKSGEVAASLMELLAKNYPEQTAELQGGTALHDPCAIAWLLNPGIFTTKACYVDVETKGELTRGVTVVDFYDVLHREPNTMVAYDVDRLALIDMLFNAVRNLP